MNKNSRAGLVEEPLKCFALTLKKLAGGEGRGDELRTFFKAQSTFTRDFLRVCCFWGNTLYFGTEEHIFRLNAVLEVLGVVAVTNYRKAQRQEEHAALLGNGEQNGGLNKKYSFVAAFLEFLDLVKRVDEMKIAFNSNGADKFTQTDDISKWPYKVHTAKFFIMDPINKHTNLLDYVTKNKTPMDLLMRFAQTTYERIKSGCDDMAILFQPQPAGVLKLSQIQSKRLSGVKFHVHICPNLKKLKPDIIFKQPRVFDESSPFNEMLDAIVAFFQASIDLAAVVLEMNRDYGNDFKEKTAKNGNVKLVDVISLTKDILDKELINLRVSWVDVVNIQLAMAAEEFDAIFALSVSSKIALGALQVSVEWQY